MTFPCTCKNVHQYNKYSSTSYYTVKNKSLSSPISNNEIMENLRCDIHHHETCWPPVLLKLHCTHCTFYPVFHFRNLPYSWVNVQQCEGTGPNGQAELSTVVDQVALTEEISQHDRDVNCFWILLIIGTLGSYDKDSYTLKTKTKHFPHDFCLELNSAMTCHAKDEVSLIENVNLCTLHTVLIHSTASLVLSILTA